MTVIPILLALALAAPPPPQDWTLDLRAHLHTKRPPPPFAVERDERVTLKVQGTLQETTAPNGAVTFVFRPTLPLPPWTQFELDSRRTEGADIRYRFLQPTLTGPMVALTLSSPLRGQAIHIQGSLSIQGRWKEEGGDQDSPTERQLDLFPLSSTRPGHPLEGGPVVNFVGAGLWALRNLPAGPVQFVGEVRFEGQREETRIEGQATLVLSR